MDQLQRDAALTRAPAVVQLVALTCSAWAPGRRGRTADGRYCRTRAAPCHHGSDRRRAPTAFAFAASNERSEDLRSPSTIYPSGLLSAVCRLPLFTLTHVRPVAILPTCSPASPSLVSG